MPPRCSISSATGSAGLPPAGLSTATTHGSPLTRGPLIAMSPPASTSAGAVSLNARAGPPRRPAFDDAAQVEPHATGNHTRLALASSLISRQSAGCVSSVSFVSSGARARPRAQMSRRNRRVQARAAASAPPGRRSTPRPEARYRSPGTCHSADRSPAMPAVELRQLTVRVERLKHCSQLSNHSGACPSTGACASMESPEG